MHCDEKYCTLFEPLLLEANNDQEACIRLYRHVGRAASATANAVPARLATTPPAHSHSPSPSLSDPPAVHLLSEGARPFFVALGPTLWASSHTPARNSQLSHLQVPHSQLRQ